jgi:hypothetical protein
MVVAVLVATIAAPMNQGILGLVSALQAFLVANPGIHIVDVDFWRYQSEQRSEIQQVSILYETGLAISGGWQVRFYQNSTVAGGLSAQDAFTQDMATATFVPWFTLDVTRWLPSRSSSQAFIVIGVNTVTDPFGYNTKNIYIAQANGVIAPSSSGAATLYDGSGSTLGVATITNVSSANPWQANERNYVVLDETTGLLIGAPTCDGTYTAWAPPASTTTTSYPLPSYFPQTPPVTLTPAPV